MAPKRPSPLDDPPAASSSEDEETSSGEEEEDAKEGSSSGEEDDDREALKPKKPAPSAPAAERKAPLKKSDSAVISQSQHSSSETGSDSESDSDTESGQKVKPIASKPMEDSLKAKKPRSKPSSSTTPARSSLKRPSEGEKGPERKKKKGPDADADDEDLEEDDLKKSGDPSKKLFQRLWSEDDEIVILKGMIDYSAKKGADPAADMNAFHDFIKKSLHVNVSRAQLMDKIRRLKKKYKNNLSRGKKGGDPTFSKLHEQKAFELSKKIWSGEGIVTGAESPKSNGTPRKNQRSSSVRSSAILNAELHSLPDAPKDEDKMEIDGNPGPSQSLNEIIGFDKSLAALALPEIVVKQGLELIAGPKRAELEDKWKKLHMEELELFVKRTELVRDAAKLVLESYKSANK